MKKKDSWWIPKRSIPIVLEYLAKQTLDSKTSNKYQIMMKTRLPRQTVYNTMRILDIQGRGVPSIYWVRVAKTTKTRVGLDSEEYELTEAGMKHVTLTNDDSLRRRLCQHLNIGFHDLLTLTNQKTEVVVDSLLNQIKPIMISRKASPGFEFTLTIKANEKGKADWHVHERH